MAGLTLRLLGGFEAFVEAGPAIKFPTKKAKALLAYLGVCPGQAHSREELATLLWGDSPDEQARRSLRQTLTYLRKALGPALVPILIVEGDTIRLDAERVEVDVEIFERLARERTIEALTRASEVYHGDLLAGLDLRAESFEEWLVAERVRLRELAIASLTTLLPLLVETGKMDGAVQAAARLIAFDPLQECIHRQLMQLYLQQGRPGSAIKQFQLCRDVLNRELGIDPEPETLALYNEIRRGGRKNIPNSTQSTRAQTITARAPAYPGPPHKPPQDAKEHQLGGWYRLWARSSVIVLIGLGVLAFWHYGLREPQREASAAAEREAASAASVTPFAEPSIAVLPFKNLSGDPALDYFSDGITEDIITGLARHPDLEVAARGSSLAYDPQEFDLRQAAQDLGVHYLLEGSVRKGGDRVRITAQLIDAVTGHHVWAERFDRENSDVFALQDAVSEKIIGSLVGGEGQIRKALYKSIWDKDSTSLKEYDYLLRGHAIFYDFSKEAMIKARSIWREGLERFPQSSLLRIKIAATHIHEARKGWTETPREDLAQAYAMVQQALADEKLPAIGQWYGHWMMTYLAVWHLRDFERAQAELDATLAVVPNDSETLASLAEIAIFAGKPDVAIALVENAIRRQRQTPGWFYWYLGWAYYLKEDYTKAARNLEKNAWPNPETYRLRAASYARLDRASEARSAVAELLRLRPETSLGSLRRTLPYKNPLDLERELAGLRLAGLPE